MAMDLRAWSKSHPWFLSSLAVTVGILFLLGSRELDPRAKFDPFWPSILRDLGIALVIGGLVTVIYESHARRLAESDTISNVLEKVVGHDVGADVWKGVMKQIFVGRPRMRRNARIYLRFDPAIAMPPDLYTLHIILRYDLCGLHSQPQEHAIRHVLDCRYQSDIPPLPCFQRVVIGDEIYEGKRLQSCVKEQVFSKTVTLPSRDDKKNVLHIEIDRAEIIRIPGSFDFAFTELTQNIRIEVGSLPGLTRKISLWSDPEGKSIDVSEEEPNTLN